MYEESDGPTSVKTYCSLERLDFACPCRRRTEASSLLLRRNSTRCVVGWYRSGHDVHLPDAAPEFAEEIPLDLELLKASIDAAIRIEVPPVCFMPSSVYNPCGVPRRGSAARTDTSLPRRMAESQTRRTLGANATTAENYGR